MREPRRGAEFTVLALLLIATVCAIGFIFVYAFFSPAAMPNALLGISIGLCLICIASALAIIGKRLVPSDELEDDYPTEHPDKQAEVVEQIHAAGSMITRKRLLLGAGTAAGCALGAAALTPVLSLGPFWDTAPLDRTPWKRGVRLVDESGDPIAAGDVLKQTFYTAFPEGADPEEIGAPIVVLHLNAADLRMPDDRSGWTPRGIVAYSKICTHAGCAVALFRKPTFATVEPQEALICPCHYSTFDPFTGGTVTFGPAGRPLPQLPLQIDSAGHLRAAGNFSARVGPGWWNVREQPT
ncbi:MAG TPA: Rieske 2Fe-2S domain-containing protein [Solirubrobacteraceae bacterium]|jgi:ubiquinol-cytochrome c reductase iron-sulfur subunit|nr:Rieske 2Fe-2S domain-containing protein [Solirubrobacteraceae bacterium]